MSREVFVDSVAWIALLHRGDSLHAQAVEEYERLVASNRTLVTTSLILIEVASAFATSSRRHLAIELEKRYRNTNIGDLVWINEDLYERGWQLYRERPDKEWSLVDCTSFIVMQDRNITEALTADHHFEQASFIKLL